MKTFKIEGWYRLNDEKDFEQEIITAVDLQMAMYIFIRSYGTKNFFKITTKQL